MDKKPSQSVPARPVDSVSARPVDIEPLYDSHEMAQKYKVSEKSLHRWARMGKIPAVKFGKLWRFRKSAIDAWVDSKAS